MQYFVGVDVGGTNIRAGLFLNNITRIIKKINVLTEAQKGKDAVIGNIISAVEKVSLGKRISGIGLGCPGLIDSKEGIIIKTPNLPLEKVRIAGMLKKRFKTKAVLGKDACCFTLAEAVYGAGKKFNTVVGITLGTGTGAGIVYNKKLFSGRGNASEAGHSIINFNGPVDTAKIPGSLEAYCCLSGIMRLANEFNLKAKNPEEIYDLAVKGNKRAKKVFEKFGFYLGVGLSNVISVLDPDIIVLGGQISNSWRFFSDSMKKSLNEHSFIKSTRILKAQLADSGIIGAYLIIK